MGTHRGRARCRARGVSPRRASRGRRRGCGGRTRPARTAPHGRGDGVERSGDLARVVRDGAGVRLRGDPRCGEARVAEGEGVGVAPARGAEEFKLLDLEVAEEDGASSGECCLFCLSLEPSLMPVLSL